MKVHDARESQRETACWSGGDMRSARMEARSLRSERYRTSLEIVHRYIVQPEPARDSREYVVLLDFQNIKEILVLV
jgi:hypothetical protein